MSTYLVLNRIHVEDANCIAGFTYGFPAITHFLGFGHALSRKLTKSHNQSLKGCAVICHKYQIHHYQIDKGNKFKFIQSKNPPSRHNVRNKESTQPIIEEGKMNMTVSLIMECPDFSANRESKKSELKQAIVDLIYQHRLAAGTIFDVEHIDFFTASDSSDFEDKRRINRIKNLLLPGFVLLDRSQFLEDYFEEKKRIDGNAKLIDTWLDLPTRKYKLDEGGDKKNKGWLVPIMNGYKAITAICEGDKKPKNTRDANTPFCFVEATHTIGEWQGCHRIKSINDILWDYHYEKDWYLCFQRNNQNSKTNNTNKEFDFNDF